MDDKQKLALGELILKTLSGDSSDQDIQRLAGTVLDDPRAMEYYKDYIILYSSLESPGLSSNFVPEDHKVLIDNQTSLRGVNLAELNTDEDYDESKDRGLTQEMLALLEMERTAPAIEIKKHVVQQPRLPMLDKSQLNITMHPKPSRGRLAFLLSVAASFLLVVGYLHFFAPKPFTAPVVATLEDSIDAVWDSKSQIPDEFGGMVQSTYGLKEGYASILFNGGAKVTVESPAKLSLNSVGDMELLSGKIYAIVPGSAKGFSVMAGNSKIVDLGTEFGVEVDNKENTEFHVTKGRTLLFVGLLTGKKEEEIKVDAGAAKKVYSDGFVKEIPVAKHRFARRISSKSGLVFRDMKFSLADIIGGGNGFGTGNRKQSIDPLAGKVTSEYVLELRQGINRFFPVEDSEYIDGVFVPDGGNGPVTVSTAGDQFENCIDTSGGCYRDISNYFQKHIDDPNDMEVPIRGVMNGVLYGTTEKPAISMHSNTGITFDLDRIRKGNPGMRIRAFTSLCGVAGDADRLLDRKAAFYVLVDGREKFEMSGLNKELRDIPVRIELTDQDRFLTLITADGGDSSGMDWCMFAMPALELVERDSF